MNTRSLDSQHASRPFLSLNFLLQACIRKIVVNYSRIQGECIHVVCMYGLYGTSNDAWNVICACGLYGSCAWCVVCMNDLQDFYARDDEKLSRHVILDGAL